MTTIRKVETDIEQKRAEREQRRIANEKRTEKALSQLVATELPKLTEAGDKLADALSAVGEVVSCYDEAATENYSFTPENAEMLLGTVRLMNAVLAPAIQALPAMKVSYPDQPVKLAA